VLWVTFDITIVSDELLNIFNSIFWSCLCWTLQDSSSSFGHRISLNINLIGNLCVMICILVIGSPTLIIDFIVGLIGNP